MTRAAGDDGELEAPALGLVSEVVPPDGLPAACFHHRWL